MSMSSHLPLIVAAAEEEGYALPMPAWAYGAIALGVVLFLLFLVWSFRRTAGVPRGVHGGHAQATDHPADGRVVHEGRGTH